MNAAAALVSAQSLEQYLHRVMPLSRAMQVAVLAVSDERATLHAPLAPNINHRSTVFGGSASTLATLAAWSLLHCRLQGRLPAASLVLQNCSMNYLRPMTTDFRAEARLAPEAHWDLFVRTLERRGRARIAATALLWCVDEETARFTGEFVALLEPVQAPGSSRVVPLVR
ncbi:MAG TPA: YiiD C-terminal domain-containing protein [Steroidobacteraceae bacterium]|jgi:thioesterase domain-containing protein